MKKTIGQLKYALEKNIKSSIFERKCKHGGGLTLLTFGHNGQSTCQEGAD